MPTRITMATGATLQFSAYGTYSDGSVNRLPDAEGNAVTAWNTSNHSMAKVSSKGHVTAVSVAEESTYRRWSAPFRHLPGR